MGAAMTQIHGFFDPRFAPVREAFAANFAEGAEAGAMVSVVIDGQMVVDLYAGSRDAGAMEPLGPDDLFNVWSTTKGLAALCVAMAADRGLIDYEAPVALYWPDFAAAGKEAITVGQLLSHQSGVCGVSQPLEDFFDHDLTAARLAASAPLFAPGTASAYNANVMGHYASALLRRTDGRSVGRFFAEEVARPLGLDGAFIGLPEAEDHRAVEMIGWEPDGRTPADPILAAAFASPPPDPRFANRRDWRAAEHASCNGQANARSLALLYGALARGGEIDGVRLLSQQGLARATAPQCEGKDKVLGLWTRWAAGWVLSNRGLYGPNPGAFGHSGWGGSFAFADPERKLGFAYTMNKMSPALSGDPRGVRLMQAALECL
jgi:CubicO group peptidase (beta-lactamase class C family)